MGFLGLPNVWRDEDSGYWKEEIMKEELDKTNFRKEVWEHSGFWFARVSSDYEDEGSLTDGGYFYKRSQSTKMRAFDSEEDANTWADRAISTKQIAISTGR